MRQQEDDIYKIINNHKESRTHRQDRIQNIICGRNREVTVLWAGMGIH